MLDDHTDGTTYFVRAVVRNARTSQLIATINLVKQSGVQEYKQDYQIPADTSGQGMYITIVTSVYTDSGYTTKSEDYGDEGETYLVDVRRRSWGGGGGSDVDYKKIRKIFEEVVAGIGGSDYDDAEVLKRIDKVRKDVLEKIEDIDIPAGVDPTPAILKAVGEATKGITAKIADIKIKDPEKPDFTPLFKSMDNLMDVLESIRKGLANADDPATLMSEMEVRLNEIMAGHKEGVLKAVDDLKPKVPKPKPKHNL